MKKKYKLGIVFVLLTLLLIPSAFAQNTSDTSEVIDTAGIWLAVTKDDYPLKNRAVECYSVNEAGVSYLVGRYVTDDNGVVYSRQRTGSLYKFVDVRTQTKHYFQVDETFPQMVHLAIFDEDDILENSSLNIITRDKDNNRIGNVAIRAFSDEDGSLVLRDRTDEHGRLFVKDFTPGTYTFTAFKEGYKPLKLHSIEILPGSIADIEFLMEEVEDVEKASLRVSVIDKDTNLPLKNSRVSVVDLRDRIIYGTGVTDDKGIVFIEDLPLGETVKIVVSKKDYSEHIERKRLEVRNYLDVELSRENIIYVQEVDDYIYPEVIDPEDIIEVTHITERLEDQPVLRNVSQIVLESDRDTNRSNFLRLSSLKDRVIFRSFSLR